MNFCSTRPGYLGIEAERCGPQQAEGEPPDKERVNATGHDRFPELEGISCVHLTKTRDGENKAPEWSVRGRVPAAFLSCRSVKVFLNEFGRPFGRRVILGGYQRQCG